METFKSLTVLIKGNEAVVNIRSHSLTNDEIKVAIDCLSRWLRLRENVAERLEVKA